MEGHDFSFCAIALSSEAMGTRGRTIIGIFIAPMMAPILLFPLFRFVFFPSAPAALWLSLVLAIIFAYGGMGLFGFPAYRFFVSRGLTSFWIAISYGFVAAIVVGAIFLLLFGIVLDGVAYGIQVWATNLLSIADVQGALVCGFVGSIVATTFWLIVRPDHTVQVKS